MTGVGEIYAAFRSGELCDDDEVAVLHGLAGTSYVALSHAMVNIRATLATAVEREIVDAATAGAVQGAAKRLHYKERRIERAIDEAAVPEAQTARLRDEWRTCYRDVKRDDALACLAYLREGRARPADAFDFADTTLWRTLVAATPARAEERLAGDDDVLDILRMQPPHYRNVRERAEVRAIALMSPPAVTEQTVPEHILTFRRRLELWSEADVEAWEARAGFDRAQTLELVRRDARVQAARSAARPRLPELMCDVLRLDGAFGALADRARRARAQIEGAAEALATPQPIDALAAWFEREIVAPHDLTMDTYAHAVDVRDEAHLVAIMRLAAASEAGVAS
jgi:hypothetical protein